MNALPLPLSFPELVMKTPFPPTLFHPLIKMLVELGQNFSGYHRPSIILGLAPFSLSFAVSADERVVPIVFIKKNQIKSLAIPRCRIEGGREVLYFFGVDPRFDTRDQTKSWLLTRRRYG